MEEEHKIYHTKKSTQWTPRLRALVFLSVIACVLLTVGIYQSGVTVRFRLAPVIYRPVNKSALPKTLNVQKSSFLGRFKTDGRWKVVSSRRYFYIYSAFYDRRLSLSSGPVVRVIGVTDEVNEGQGLCVLFYDLEDGGEDHLMVPIEYVPIGAGVFYRAMLLKEYLFTCKLPDKRQPYEVSIILDSAHQPKSFLPVEVPEVAPIRADFVLCMSVAYWDHKPLHIIEWMETLRIFGVDMVVVYNSSLTPEASKVFQYYDQQERFVDFRQSHSFIVDHETKPFHLQMSPVINDCMYRNMYRFKKVLVTDMDELIVPHLHSSYGEMLQYIDHLDPSNHPGRSYTFHNAYFFLDLPESRSHSNHSLSLLTESRRWRMPASKVGYACKTIVDPQSCVAMHNHFCWRYTDLYANGDQVLFVDKALGLNHHYKKCHFDDFEGDIGKCDRLMTTAVKDETMLKFKNELRDRVERVAEELGVRPPTR